MFKKDIPTRPIHSSIKNPVATVGLLSQPFQVSGRVYMRMELLSVYGLGIFIFNLSVIRRLVTKRSYKTCSE
jgi:hypothetical protein